jgi:hypothetical protein
MNFVAVSIEVHANYPPALPLMPGNASDAGRVAAIQPTLPTFVDRLFNGLKVVRINTQRVATAKLRVVMVYDHADRNRTPQQLPGHPVCPKLSSTGLDSPIASPVCPCHPQPATICLVDLWPKPRFKWLRDSAWHVSQYNMRGCDWNCATWERTDDTLRLDVRTWLPEEAAPSQ